MYTEIRTPLKAVVLYYVSWFSPIRKRYLGLEYCFVHISSLILRDNKPACCYCLDGNKHFSYDMVRIQHRTIFDNFQHLVCKAPCLHFVLENADLLWELIHLQLSTVRWLKWIFLVFKAPHRRGLHEENWYSYSKNREALSWRDKQKALICFLFGAEEYYPKEWSMIWRYVPVVWDGFPNMRYAHISKLQNARHLSRYSRRKTVYHLLKGWREAQDCSKNPRKYTLDSLSLWKTTETHLK